MDTNLVPTFQQVPSRGGIGVAFGGGGMRGWAHLGVVSVLDGMGLKPTMVSGCSAGALLSAFWVSGFTVNEMVRLMREQQTASLFSLRVDGAGLLSSDGMRAYLTKLLGNRTFEDCTIPFAVVCTDLERGREVVIQSGRLVDALMATMAVPGVFAPVEHEGRLLVDGGLCNNVPVSVLVAGGVAYTIAVRNSRPERWDDVPVWKREEERQAAALPVGDAGWALSVGAWAERLKLRFTKNSSRTPNALEVINRSLEIMMDQLVRYKLSAYPPDLLITPEVSHIGLLSVREEKASIFSAGEEAALRHKEEILRMMQHAQRRSAS